MTSTRSVKPFFDRRLARFAAVVGLLSAIGVLSSPGPANAAGTAAQAELKFATERKLARRNLERAHERVENARADVRATKAELDDFVEKHFKRPAPAVSQRPEIEIRPLDNPVENPEAERIGRRLHEVTEQQNHLLELYTPMHPEVVQLELLRSSLSEQLAAITESTERDRPSKKSLPKAANTPSEDLNLLDPEEDSVAKYKAIFLRWQIAGRELQAALKAEAAAVEKLASIKLVLDHSSPEAISPVPAEIARPAEPGPRSESDTLIEEPSPADPGPRAEPAPRMVATPSVESPPKTARARPTDRRPRAEQAPGVVASPPIEIAPTDDSDPSVDTAPRIELAPPVDLEPHDETERLAIRSTPAAPRALAPTDSNRIPREPQKNSQPLALVAMLAALALAGLAAIKLARASNQGVFASADEVGSALALPVVGVIPAIVASSPARATGRPVLRGAKLFLEIGLAIVVFAAVAYFVQDPSSFWRFWDHPLEWLDFAAHSRIAK